MEGDGSRLAVGTTIGEYRVEECLRVDGDVAVYRARQAELARDVELRVRGDDAGFLERARRLAALDDPALLPVLDAGRHDGRVFVAVGLGGARPLPEVLAAGPLPADRAVAMVAAVVSGLEALERAGFRPRLVEEAILVHRDGALLDSVTATGGEGVEPTASSVAGLLSSVVDADGARRMSRVLERASSYPSAASVAEAARAAIAPPRRRSRRWALAAFGVAAAGAAAAVLIAGGGDDRPARPPASAPAARIAATIPLGAEPMSVSYGAGAVWVGTSDRQLLKVDPRTTRVVGSPVRIARGRRPTNITVRANRTAVFAFDAVSRTALRVDPRTAAPVRRVRLERHPSAAVVTDDAVWVAGTRDPEGFGPADLVRLDPRTLREQGDPVPVGSGVNDLEIGAGAIYATASGGGTVTRVDTRTGRARTVTAGAATVNSALIGDELWVPDVGARAVEVLDASLRRPADVVLFPGPTVSVVELGGRPWLLVLDSDAPDAAASLVGVDPASGRRVGRPIRLGGVTGFPAQGGGALWIGATQRRALLRVVPADPAPGAGRSLRGTGDRLRTGPAPAGRRVAGEVAGVRTSLAAPDREWLLTEVPPVLGAYRFRQPEVGLTVGVPEQLIRADGSTAKAKDADAVMRHVLSHRGLRTGPVRRVRLGSATARQVDLRTRPYPGSPPFCGQCTAVFGMGPITILAEEGATTRLTVLDVGGRPVAVIEDGGPGGRGLPTTSALARTLRFG